jgi:hypothetical protein
VNVAADHVYSVGARLFIPEHSGSAYAAINVWAYAGVACTGTFLAAVTPAFVGPVNGWQAASAAIETTPATRSLLVRLVAIKPLAQPSLEVLFDDVLLRSDPTRKNPIRMW